MPSPSSADRNLLLGVLALQLDFLTRDALIAGMNAWAVDKTKPLGRILCEQGALPPARLGLLDALVDDHLDRHGGDVEASLASASNGSTLAESFDGVADPDVRSTLSALAVPRLRIAPTVRDGIRFRNLRPHARGGLGEVFVAEDAELKREVAVKEIQLHRADDPISRARFVREAEITGALEHPGIIPVYGLGTHPDGRPYYAMRFVRGETLKAAIERYHDGGANEPAELRRLLRRLIDACNAVAYAHSRGVVHRDLKPANILLGPFGETLVVDWGLAKAGVDRVRPDPANAETTDPTVRPSGSDVGPTQAGAALGTPGYMSPEQAAGRHDAVGPATDVFGLGATMYSVLTGRKPFEATTIEDELARTKKGDYPPARTIAPGVPAALDAMCRKALALHPTDRYPSALDLAADLERWLADEPVCAYRDRWPARAGRWARRHRSAVAAAGVFLVVTTLASGIGSGLLWRAERKTAEQRRESEENYELARDLSGSGIELIAANEAQYAADPVKHKARKELLVAAAKAYHKHLEHQPEDPEVRRQAARVYRYAANVHRLEREHAAAEELYADAVGLLEGLAGQFTDVPAYRLQLSETLRDQAKVQSTLGRLAEAVGILKRAVELVEQLAAADPRQVAFRRSLATTLLNLSTVELTRGRYAEVERAADRSGGLFLELGAGPGASAYDPLLEAATWNVRAVARRGGGRSSDALPLHAKSVNILAGLRKAPAPGMNPAEVRHSLNLCRLQQCRTWALLEARRTDADNNLGGVIADWEELARTFPAIPMYRESLGAAYQVRGQVRLETGRLADALADLDKSRIDLEEAVRRTPDVPELQGDLGRTYALLARLARERNDTAARDWTQKATAALRAAVAAAPESVRDQQSLREVK
jgi:eukaryotic-like serine/threonine-protein kinase